MKSFGFWAVAVAGLSFWFLVGFPFGNHNESFIWVVQLDRIGFVDALTTTLRPVANFRPLGTGTAWLLYKISGGSVSAQQLFNFLLAVWAWWIALSATPSKRLFSGLALLSGGAFFSGYIFLFHIHGVFYGPLLLYFAWLLKLATAGPMPSRRLVLAAAGAVVVYLYHPFAAPLFLAFLVGYVMENRQKLHRSQIGIVGGLFVAITVGMLVVGTGSLKRDPDLVARGLLTSYRMVEVNRLVGVASMVLTVIAVSFWGRGKRWIIGGIAGAGVAAACCLAAAVPLVVLWVLVCALRAVLARRWGLAALMAMSMILPVAAATGSPTYTVFVLMACCLAACLGGEELDSKLRVPAGKTAALVWAAVATFALCLRLGVSVPGLSTAAHPILAEREKTFQAMKIADWLLDQGYRAADVSFCQPASSPVYASDAVERTRRAPTSNVYYRDHLRGRRDAEPDGPIRAVLICFGGQTIDGGTAVFEVPGRFNGAAVVYAVEDSEAQ